MILDIEISNFRCFRNERLAGCSRINQIVGDNGSGKTALMEALFLTLAGSPEVALRIRQHRGLESAFQGSPKIIEEALWSGFFYGRLIDKTIHIGLSGDGPESRSLSIFRASGETLIPFNPDAERITPSSIVFEWRDASGVSHRYAPTVSSSGIKIPPSEEDLPDFFMFPSNLSTSTIENAARFSDLSKVNRQGEFVDIFRQEYPWIKDLGIEVLGGFPVIYATVEGVAHKIPLNEVSYGVNRLFSILLAIASRPRSVVLVDEIENGIYFEHHEASWRALLNLCDSFDCQLFLSTHSAEWIKAGLNVVDDRLSELAFWRVERGDSGSYISRLSGRDVKDGIEIDEEIR